MELKIKNVERTCYACPSIYDFEVVDHPYFKEGYIRYRWGALSFVLINQYGKEIFRQACAYGDPLEGMIGLEEAINVLGLRLEISLEQ